MQFVAGNAVTLLENGEQYFPALEAAIDGAEREVFLQSYIFEDDGVSYGKGAVDFLHFKVVGVDGDGQV